MNPTEMRPRSPIQYVGGKGPLAPRVVPLIPPGEVYVEPYAGAASVFWHICWRAWPYRLVVLNDLDERIVGLYRVLQDPETFARFAHRVALTLYARREYERAVTLLDSPDAVERAWAVYVALNQGIERRLVPLGKASWGRELTTTGGVTRAWQARVQLLGHWHEMLMQAQIECRDALAVIGEYDGPGTVFYLDPPYVQQTRTRDSEYTHEMSDDDHRALVERLLTVRGSAVVSGYDHPIYQALDEAGWERYEVRTNAFSAARTAASGLQGSGAAAAKVPRTEVIWRWAPRDYRQFRLGEARAIDGRGADGKEAL